MTPAERAEKIFKLAQHIGFGITDFAVMCDIQKLIEEAEWEAYESANKDFNWLQSAVAKVYCAMTDNKMSKWNYEPETVIAEMEDTQNQFFEKEIEQARLDGFSAAREKAKGIANGAISGEISDSMASGESKESRDRRYFSDQVAKYIALRIEKMEPEK